MKHTWNRIYRLLAAVAAVAVLVAAMPLSALTAEHTAPVTVTDKVADPSTIDWTKYFGSTNMDTEFAGGIWTDKSVFTAATDELPGVALNDKNHFLVALSAIASNLSITGHASLPTDTMLVLDMSGSMVNGTYEVGTIRRNNRYETVEGVDMSLIEAMIEATNAAIDTLMKQNVNNRVGVVLYSGNAATNQAATASTATVVLPLGRYNGVSGEYLSVDADYTTSTLYTYTNYRWRENGTATYVAEGEEVNVSVKNGLTDANGTAVRDTSKRANGGTYIQNGLYQAMNQFLAVTDTTVPEGNLQAGVERKPVLVLMSDGAPTIATTDYANIGNSNVGDGSGTNNRITFLTQLTAAYVRGRIAAKYRETAADEGDVLFLTLGLGTENSSAATDTLYPQGSNTTLQGYWDTYLAANAGVNVQVGSGNSALTVQREAHVQAMNYVDTYYYANDAQTLIDSFNEIVSEIELKAGSYATLVEGGDANYSGYITFEDELGELMHVQDMKGVLMSDGNGGTMLYSGMEIAKGMSEGALGTVDTPSARGDELVRTVRERIPGLTTSQAQQLIGYAYADRQLYYDNDDSWSNYIGWYANADGEYVGFWDKDSGYEHAPSGAVYANRSYGYLGVNGNSDMMHVVVMVRTELATLHQTVYFKIPAALVPTVQYKVTLDENDHDKVEEFECVDTVPMQLVFEVGLRSDINAVNMEQKIAEHVAKGGHVHRNADGSVTFYTNEWAIGNDKNGNGIPDREEVETALVAESHFHPAMDNTRYYYTEDTLVLNANGTPVSGSTRPAGNYYHQRYYYTETERVEILVPVAADTLAEKAQYDSAADRWYIPAGTIFSEVERFKVDKAENRTNTLGYSNYPHVFENGAKQDVYAFLGNNGAITVYPASGIALRKELQGTIANVDTYTFEVTLSNLPSGTAAAPVLTDANGDPLADVVMSALNNNRFTVTMPANVTAYISGIPVGTTVQIAEQINGDYKVVGITAGGAQQAVNAPATVTVPAYSANGTQMVPVVFVNAANTYGDLVISKDIVHSLASDPAAMATKTFIFRVQLSGDKIAAGQTFLTSEGVNVQVGANGYLTYANGNPITLGNEESLTVFAIPEGTAYTVTEETAPGFALDSINGDTAATAAVGTIRADGENTAAFVNRYPDTFTPKTVPLALNVEKVLNSTQYNGDEQFVFVLQMLREDGTYPPLADDNGNTYLKLRAGESGTANFTLNFDKLGTYFFRVIELKPSEQTPPAADTNGMVYSPMQALFEVVVTDEDMNGELEVDVREEAHVTVTEGATVSVSTTFVNEYEVDATHTTLSVRKTLNDKVNAGIPLTQFSFTLCPCDANGNVQAGATGTVVTASALGGATFDILLNTVGTHYFKVVENIPAAAVQNRLNGMTYDPTAYLFTVETEANTAGELEVVAQSLYNLTANENVAPANRVYTAQFTNTYELTSTEAEIAFSKELIGRDPYVGEEYVTTLVATDGAFNVLTGADAWAKTYPLAPDSGDVIALTFDKVGSYHYKWYEEIPAAARWDAARGRYVLNGVVYDNAEYHITVTVSDNGDGTLANTVTVHKVGTAAAVNAVTFVNEYVVDGRDTVTIGGKKVLNGRKLAAEEFTIGLYADAACTNAIATATNAADGTFAFPPLTFTAADLGANNADAVYRYYVKEIADNKGGVTYDTNVYEVTVTVSHKDGALVVTPSGNATTLTIQNTYTANPATITLSGSKTLAGDWGAVDDKSFTFRLYKADAAFNVTDTTPVAERTVNGNGTFTIEQTYRDGEEGTYYFVLEEVIPATRTGGVSYDAGEYHVTVTVSDPGDGHLAATVTLYRPGTGNVAVAAFTNAYAVEPTTVTLAGNKTYVNSVTGAALPMDEGMFSFVVLEDHSETPVSVGYNLADGTIVFSPIHYHAAGTHTYRIVEVRGTDGGVTYDENTAYTVTVNVVDNGNGTLTATADYGNTPVVFRNTYTHEAAQVTFSGEKRLEGDWSAVAPTDRHFEFALYAVDDAGNLASSPLEYAYNETDGSFTFGTETYTVAGTYRYAVCETLGGTAAHGITYDDAVYHITVVVTDDGNGNLIPTVTAEESGVTVTADAANARLVNVDGLVFRNTYQPQPTTWDPEAQKQYDGDEMKAFDFVLTVDGDEKQVKQNDKNGKVDFDELTFDRVGTYELTVREQENLLWGLIRWDRNVYTITLHVEDDGKGQLFVNEEKTTVTSVKGRDDLIFRNTHHEIITKKDVFLTADPTVSVDGKEVKVNDVLRYTISYTNFDSVAVDVTVTDIVPQYTAYVEGSADNDGSFADGVLTWELKDIAPNATVTVSFEVKVVEVAGAVTNSATVLEGENEYTTNQTSTTVQKPAPYELILRGDKQLSGRDMVDGEFAFTLFTERGEGLEKVTNVNGEFVFSAIEITAPGIYTYRVAEAAGDDENVTYDETVYTVVATVVYGAGTLELESLTVTADGETAELIFRNTYVTPPTDPDDPVDPPVVPDDPIDPPVTPDDPVDPPVTPDDPVDPPVVPDTPVDTGEHTNIPLLAALLFVSGGLFAVALFGGKRRRNEAR